jgi:uncharacterized membrane protein
MKYIFIAFGSISILSLLVIFYNTDIHLHKVEHLNNNYVIEKKRNVTFNPNVTVNYI